MGPCENLIVSSGIKSSRHLTGCWLAMAALYEDIYFYKLCHKSEYWSLDFISSTSFTILNAARMWQALPWVARCTHSPLQYSGRSPVVHEEVLTFYTGAQLALDDWAMLRVLGNLPMNWCYVFAGRTTLEKKLYFVFSTPSIIMKVIGIISLL